MAPVSDFVGGFWGDSAGGFPVTDCNDLGNGQQTNVAPGSWPCCAICAAFAMRAGGANRIKNDTELTTPEQVSRAG